MRHREIKAAAGLALARSSIKTGRLVRFVRRLVLAESGIAVDAIDGLRRLGHILGRELPEIGIDRGDQLEHRLFDNLFESLFARLEPLAAIVAREAAKELQHLGRKTGKRGLHETPPLIIKLMATPEETSARLAEIPNLTVSTHTPLSLYTRFGIGGPAD